MKFFTSADIAERYGIKVSTVWDWLRSGKLKAIRIGKEYRISEEDLKKFEKERSVRA